MQTLFNDSEVFQKERPVKPTEQQLKKFYSEQAKEIIKQGFSDSDEEDIISDLESLYPFNDNGFEMAKDLERGNGYYEIDTSFCEWLDCLDSDFRQLNTDNVKAWVKAHNPQPKFNDGQKLLIVENLCHGMKKDMIVYVNYKREEEAVYIVDTDPTKRGGTILDYERVEKCCVVA
jgi:hypothetical protein